MREYYPILIVVSFLSLLSISFLIAYFRIKFKERSQEKNIKDSNLVHRILSYALPYKKQFVVVGVLILVSIAYDIAAPIFVGKIEELIKSDFELKQLYLYVGVYALILIISLVCSYVQVVVLQKTGQKIVSAIREDLFEKIQKFSHRQLNSASVGTYVTRIANDTNAISVMFTNTLSNLVKNIFVIVGILAAMFFVNYQLTFMVLCFAPFIILFTFIFRFFIRRAHRRVKDGTTDINIFLSENLSGMKITQLFGMEKKKNEDFSKKNKRLMRANKNRIIVTSVFRPMIFMLYVSSVLCLFYLGARGYLDNTNFLGQSITAGVVVTFYMYITKFFTPIQNLAEQFNHMQSAFASAEKIFSVMDTEPELTDAVDAIEIEKINGEIEFKNVWFAYEKEEWVLKDVSFKIKANQTAAFVGSTGSGKSTVISLICRNYDIQKGQILIDGIDIKRIKISSLRSHIGQMLQEVFLFSDTVKNNISLGAHDIEESKVLSSCKYVNALGFIENLNNGFDEYVRERGNNFSAGQRQLLSFARTVAHDPDMMILDEATSNIDTETEKLIQDSLEKIRGIGTTIVIAHRLSTVKNADVIFVMSKGKVIEEGTSKELLEKKGKYYQLYTLQYQQN